MNDLNDEPTQEYDDDLIALLEAVWGRGVYVARRTGGD